MTPSDQQAERLLDPARRDLSTTLYRARAVKAVSAALAEKDAEIERLRLCVMWSVENDGECLGDWPKLLARAKAALTPDGEKS